MGFCFAFLLLFLLILINKINSKWWYKELLRVGIQEVKDEQPGQGLSLENSFTRLPTRGD